MRRSLILVCFLLEPLFIFTSVGQEYRPGHRLLWEITGPDIKKSYLFGTMHTRDSRAFEFNDSVLFKLKSCDVFANEVHPDSLMRAWYQSMVTTQSVENKFKSILSKKDYEMLDTMLLNHTGYSLEKLRTPRSLFFTEMRGGGPGDYNSQRKETFLDAWLFGLARKWGKITTGVEKASDQLALIDDPTADDIKTMVMNLTGKTDQDAAFKKLLQMYRAGDINGLRSLLIESFSADRYKRLVTDRNLVMVENLLALARTHSSFVAVGAGHLAGDEGIIRLLHARGYRVKAIEALFTGAGPDLTATTIYPWVTYKSAEAGYSVSMPAAPFSYRVDSVMVTYNTHVDLSTMSIFQTFCYVPEVEGKTNDEKLTTLEKFFRSSKDVRIVELKRITYKGFPGIEYRYLSSGNFFRSRSILRNGLVYAVEVGWNRAATTSPNAEKFLNSLEFQEMERTDFKEFADADGAFSVRMRGTPQRTTQTVEEGDYKSQEYLFYSEDLSHSQVFIVKYNDIPAGYTSTRDNYYHDIIIKSIVEQTSAVDVKRYDIDVDGFKAAGFSLNSQPLWYRGASVARGNRYYLLMAASLPKDSAEVEKFFTSFRFRDFRQGSLRPYELEGGKVMVHLPDQYKLDSTMYRNEYRSLDPLSGTTFTVTLTELSKYTEFKTWGEFFKDESYTAYDSLISIDSLKTNESYTRITTGLHSMSNAAEHKRVTIQGRWKLTLTARAAIGKRPATADLFLTSAVLKVKADDWNIFSRKIDTLLGDLQSGDSTTMKNAVGSLIRYDFKIEDLPKLYGAIEKEYPVNENEYDDPKTGLLDGLAQCHDNTTQPFIERIYPSLSKNAGAQEAALGVLASLKTKESMLSMKQKLLALPPDQQDLSAVSVVAPLEDSLELGNYVLPELLDEIERFAYPGYVISTIHEMLDSGVLNTETKLKTQQRLLALARKRLNVGSITADSNYVEIYLNEQLVAALDAIDYSKEVGEILVKFAAWKDPLISQHVLPTLLKNKVKVKKSQLELVAKDPLYRLELLEKLKKIGREKDFPAQYLTDEKRAESSFFVYMNEEEGTPHDVTMVGSQQAIYDGKQMTFFAFVYNYEDEPGSRYYVLCAPPIKADDLFLLFGEDGYEGKAGFQEKMKSLLKENGAIIR